MKLAIQLRICVHASYLCSRVLARQFSTFTDMDDDEEVAPDVDTAAQASGFSSRTFRHHRAAGESSAGTNLARVSILLSAFATFVIE